MALEASGPGLRLIQVVEFLARSPTARHTTSEIARGAGVNRTTCLSLLLALEERGWVQRHADSRYQLGGRLVSLGEAALASLDIAEAVQPQLVELAGELAMEAIASVISGTDIVIVAQSPGPGAFSNTARVGQTVPFAPPFGLAHLIGAPPGPVEQWLDRSAHPLDDAERSAYRSAIARASDGGLITVLDADSRRRFEELVTELAHSPASRSARERRDQLLGSLARDHSVLSPPESAEHAEVSQIQAPVPGPDGRPLAAIGVNGLPHQIKSERLATYAEAVSRTARIIADTITA